MALMNPKYVKGHKEIFYENLKGFYNTRLVFIFIVTNPIL